MRRVLLLFSALLLFGKSAISAPTVILLQPLAYSVATPQLSISVSCSACSTVSAIDSIIGRTLASGPPPLQQVITIPQGDGTYTLKIQAKDDAGHTTTISYPIYVDTSTALTELITVPGPILDIDSSRVLYTGSDDTGNYLKIRNRASGTDTTIFAGSAMKVFRPYFHTFNYLTPSGAIFLGSLLGNLNAWIYEFRNGTLNALEKPVGDSCSDQGLVVSGTWAAWQSDGPTCDVNQWTIQLRDLTAGVTQTVVQNRTAFNVSENGSVVFAGPDRNIYQYANGTTVQITKTDPPTLNEFPVSDGTSILYERQGPPKNIGLIYQTFGFYVWANGVEKALTPFELRIGGGTAGPPLADLRQVNGWSAFVAQDAGYINQVFVTQSGHGSQSSRFSTSSKLDALAPDGSLTFSTSSRIYLSKNPLKLSVLDAGPFFGDSDPSVFVQQAFQLDGSWIEVVGRSALLIGAGPDAYTQPDPIRFQTTNKAYPSRTQTRVYVTRPGSVYEIVSITASAGGQPVKLYYDLTVGQYASNIPIVAGETALTITATDYFGHSASVVAPIAFQ